MTIHTVSQPLEDILCKIEDVQLRLALAAAVFFVDNHREKFTEHAGTYGAEGLQRLLDTNKEQPQ